MTMRRSVNLFQILSPAWAVGRYLALIQVLQSRATAGIEPMRLYSCAMVTFSMQMPLCGIKITWRNIQRFRDYTIFFLLRERSNACFNFLVLMN